MAVHMYLCFRVSEWERRRKERRNSLLQKSQNRWSLIGLIEKSNSLQCWCDSIEKN